jgi:5'-3' exonuclease
MLALLVDGLNLVRRIYAAVPGDEDTAEHDDGVLRSCTRSIERALAGIGPSHALCAFDGAGRSWRHELLPTYKANRPPMPETLAQLLPRIREAFEADGVRCVEVPGFEADDVLASIAVRIAARGGEAVILSTDKSMLSLLRDGVRVRNHFDERELDASYVRERFGVAPDRLPSWLALVGESSQGVPGVRSVGPKTATRLIAEHGDLGAILEAAAQIPGKLGEALRAHADDARLSLTLATLRTDVAVGLNLNQCRVG